MGTPSGTELLLIFGIAFILLIGIASFSINIYKSKYSRLKFWIWSTILFVLLVFVSLINNEIRYHNDLDNLKLILGISQLLIVGVWINALANRIRDYGSNPNIAIFAVIPILNIILALYYGIARKKRNTQEDNEFYKQVMEEIEQNNLDKASWAKAYQKAKADENKAKSYYISIRVEQLKKDIKDNKQIMDIEDEQQNVMDKEQEDINVLTPKESDFLKQYNCDANSDIVNITKRYIKIESSDGRKLFNRIKQAQILF